MGSQDWPMVGSAAELQERIDRGDRKLRVKRPIRIESGTELTFPRTGDTVILAGSRRMRLWGLVGRICERIGLSRLAHVCQQNALAVVVLPGAKLVYRSTREPDPDNHTGQWGERYRDGAWNTWSGGRLVRFETEEQAQAHCSRASGPTERTILAPARIPLGKTRDASHTEQVLIHLRDAVEGAHDREQALRECQELMDHLGWGKGL